MSDQQEPHSNFEYDKWAHDNKRADFERVNARYDELFDKMNEAAIRIADGALRAALLINGGAAVSVLAFIGTLATKSLITVNQLSIVATSLELFSFGVASAVVGMGFSYMTHFLDAARIASFVRITESPFVTTGPTTNARTLVRNAAHVAAFFAGILCIVFFIWGMFSVRNAIEHLQSTAAAPEALAPSPVSRPSK